MLVADNLHGIAVNADDISARSVLRQIDGCRVALKGDVLNHNTGFVDDTQQVAMTRGIADTDSDIACCGVGIGFHTHGSFKVAMMVKQYLDSLNSTRY